MELMSMDEDDLRTMLPMLDAESGKMVRAVLAMRTTKKMQSRQKEWLEEQMPENMKRPYAVAIKQERDGPAFGGTAIVEEGHRLPGSRKLLPGEVVVVDIDKPLIQRLLARGIIELSEDTITRPIVYPTSSYADYCNPNRVEVHAERDPLRAEQAAEDMEPLVLEIRAQYARCRGVRSEEASSELDKQVKAFEIKQTAATIVAQEENEKPSVRRRAPKPGK